jgi:hypothetical protein
MESARGGAARQFALRSADRAALVHGQYRRASRPSSVQQDPVLSVAAGAAPASGLAKVGRLTLVQSILCVRLVLWDEAARRLISFRKLRTLPSYAAG